MSTQSGKIFTKFPHIDQYRQVITFCQKMNQYEGKNEDGKVIWNYDKFLPKYIFTGTVKIHGTNSAVGQRNHIRWCQSRKNIIDIGNDNAGFAHFVNNKKESFDHLFNRIKNEGFNGEDLTDKRILIFGEWFGKGIQNGVAISQLSPPKFAIFDIICLNDSEDDVNTEGMRLTENIFKTISDHENDIYNIYDFGEYHIEIDLNDPKMAVSEITNLTLSIEEECPVGKYFGISGYGEGIVWSYLHSETSSKTKGRMIRFKTKGEKHSSSKVKSVKQLITISPEEIKNIEEFLNYAVTKNRLEQGIKEVCSNEELSTKHIKIFIQWVLSDVLREEADTIAKNEIKIKNLIPEINKRASKFILEKLKG